MVKLIEMVMPKMGESIMEAKILVWHKMVGQRIERDETIAEVATDKVDTELPSLVAGIVRKIIIQEGEMALVGQPMCVIEQDADGEISTESLLIDTLIANNETNFIVKEVLQIEEKLNPFDNNLPIANAKNEERFYSPLVLNIAKTEGISVEELGSIVGTGLDARVTKHDIFAFVENRKSGNIPVKVVEKQQVM